MTITQIKRFLAVGKELSFTKAAQYTYISQPALSKDIAALERELNFLLFYRGKKGLKLTREGEVLYNRLSNVPQLVDDAIEEASSISKHKVDSLSIGIMQDKNIDELVIETYQMLQIVQSDLHIEIKRCDFDILRKGLKTSRFDAIITPSFEAGINEKIIYETIMQQPVYIAVNNNHPIARRDLLGVEDLKDVSIVFFSEGDSLSRDPMEMLSALSLFDIKTIHYLKVDTMSNFMLNVELGNGIAIVGKGTYLQNYPNIKLVELNSKKQIDIVLAYRKDNKNPMLPLYINSIKSVIK